MMKRILIVLPSFLNGGTNTSLRNMLPVLKETGVDIDVFAITCVGTNREYVEKFANVIGIGGNSLNNVSKLSLKQKLAKYVKIVKKGLCKIGIDISPVVFNKVTARLERNNYDLIIAFQEGITTHFVSCFTHTPKIAWIHCDYKAYLKAVKCKPETKIYDGFEKVVCVSEFTKQQFIDCVPHKNCIALHNIIDDNSILLRAKLPIDNPVFNHNQFTILSIGRLDPVKRFEAIPSIINELKQKDIYDFRWYILGGGDENQKRKIEEAIANNNASELTLLGETNNPYPYIAQADMVVSTSVSEACPNVINEAKILHTPIVATNFGSVYEFIEDGVNGLISPIESIADKIAMMITDQELYHQIKSNISTFRYDNDLLKSKLLTSILEIES